jgi:7-cyano-7-deazaguanine synthase
MNWDEFKTFSSPLGKGEKAIVVMSGGMDSTVLLHLIKARGFTPIAISFDYGQRHNIELAYARSTCLKLNVEHRVVDLKALNPLLHGSALTDPTINVPHGHYADETMKQTVVPNRNMILLSVAIGSAVAERAVQVSIGVHAGDHAIYPDCRPVFIDHMTLTARHANEGFLPYWFKVDAPFVDKTKTDIAKIGDFLKVEWVETWSCYEGGVTHCGKCGTCVERIEAFRDAKIEDPTLYALRGY